MYTVKGLEFEFVVAGTSPSGTDPDDRAAGAKCSCLMYVTCVCLFQFLKPQGAKVRWRPSCGSERGSLTKTL